MWVLVSKEAVEGDDEFIFFISKVSSLHIGPEIVYPPKPATPLTSQQPWRPKYKNKNKIKTPLKKTPKRKSDASQREKGIPAALVRDPNSPSSSAFIHLMFLLPRKLNILRTSLFHLMLLLIFRAFIFYNTNPLFSYLI